MCRNRRSPQADASVDHRGAGGRGGQPGAADGDSSRWSKTASTSPATRLWPPAPSRTTAPPRPGLWVDAHEAGRAADCCLHRSQGAVGGGGNGHRGEDQGGDRRGTQVLITVRPHWSLTAAQLARQWQRSAGLSGTGQEVGFWSPFCRLERALTALRRRCVIEVVDVVDAALPGLGGSAGVPRFGERDQGVDGETAWGRRSRCCRTRAASGPRPVVIGVKPV